MTGNPIKCARCGEVIDPAVIDETFEFWTADGKPRHRGICPKFKNTE